MFGDGGMSLPDFVLAILSNIALQSACGVTVEDSTKLDVLLQGVSKPYWHTKRELQADDGTTFDSAVAKFQLVSDDLEGEVLVERAFNVHHGKPDGKKLRRNDPKLRSHTEQGSKKFCPYCFRKVQVKFSHTEAECNRKKKDSASQFANLASGAPSHYPDHVQAFHVRVGDSPEVDEVQAEFSRSAGDYAHLDLDRSENQFPAGNSHAYVASPRERDADLTENSTAGPASFHHESAYPPWSPQLSSSPSCFSPAAFTSPPVLL